MWFIKTAASIFQSKWIGLAISSRFHNWKTQRKRRKICECQKRIWLSETKVFRIRIDDCNSLEKEGNYRRWYKIKSLRRWEPLVQDLSRIT